MIWLICRPRFLLYANIVYPTMSNDELHYQVHVRPCIQTSAALMHYYGGDIGMIYVLEILQR